MFPIIRKHAGCPHTDRKHAGCPHTDYMYIPPLTLITAPVM